MVCAAMESNLPLLLIPGLACNGDLFADQIASLGADREVQVADHTGFDSFEELGRSILASAPPEFALAGLSMGGYLSFELLRQAPQRVRRLALLDTSARADTAQKIADRKGAIELARLGRFEQVQRAGLPMLIAGSRAGDTVLKDRVLRMAWDMGSEAWARQMNALMSRPCSLDLLPGITCPTLVMVGDDDRLTPLAGAREMAQAIPQAKLEVIADCGHLSSMERPRQVTELLRAWLAEAR